MSGRAQPAPPASLRGRRKIPTALPAVADGGLRHHDRDRQEAAGILEKVAQVEVSIVGIDEPGATLARGVRRRNLCNRPRIASGFGVRLGMGVRPCSNGQRYNRAKQLHRRGKAFLRGSPRQCLDRPKKSRGAHDGQLRRVPTPPRVTTVPNKALKAGPSSRVSLLQRTGEPGRVNFGVAEPVLRSHRVCVEPAAVHDACGGDEDKARDRILTRGTEEGQRQSERPRIRTKKGARVGPERVSDPSRAEERQ
jgi:hypothetical protein